MDDKRVFIGFDYHEHFKKVLGSEIASWFRSKSVEPLFPLDKNPGGDLLYRILQFITDSNFTLFDCTTLNPNVCFELGYTIGKHLPFFILYDTSYLEKIDLPPVLKTQWGIWYDSIDSLKSSLEPIASNPYPKGYYDCRTNQLNTDVIGSELHLETIAVVKSKSIDCSTELKLIQQCWPQSKIEEIIVEDQNSMVRLVEHIGSFPMVIVFLSPLLDKSDSGFKVNNEINARIMSVAGLTHGMDKNLLMFQDGEKDYSDVTGLAHHYKSSSEFQIILNDWNRRITSRIIRGDSTRIGLPNFGKLIVRNHLHDFIDQHLFSKAIFLRAPSGYGKSALIKQFLENKTYPNIWYTCDSNSIEFSDFVFEILSALSNLDPFIGRNLQSVLASYAKKEILESNLSAYLLSELRAFGKRIVLILDDVHLVGTSSFVQHLHSLLVHRPPNVGLFLLSREDFDQTIRVNVDKHYVEIKKNELKFGKHEIRTYVETVLGISLLQQELDLLAEKSEGWIASISLLKSIVAQKGKSAISEIIARLSGTDVKIYDYFAEIVYDNFPSDTKELLLKTSVLNVLKPSSVAFLLNNTPYTAAQMLRDLERKNSFLFNFENHVDEYQYHSLFREFLEQKHNLSVGEDSVNLLKFKLADFYFMEGNLIDAIRFGINGKNYVIAAKALSKSGSYILNEGMGRMFSDWISQVPAEYYNKDYNLLIMKGRSEEQIGEIVQAKETYVLVQTILAQHPNTDKEKLLVKFMKLQIDMVQERDYSILEEESLCIRKEANRLKDHNLYFSATDIYFDIKWQILLKQHRQHSPPYELYDKLVQEIDAALSELSISPLVEKNIHRCQLLSNKARVLNFINGLKSARLIIKIQLSELSSNPPNNETRQKWLKDILSGNNEEAKCIDEALSLSEKENAILNANVLVERVELMTGKYQFHSMILGRPPVEFLDSMLVDYNKALDIYAKFDHKYGMASVYNNVAKLFLLKDDKVNRDKYSNLAIKLAKEFQFQGIISRAENILEMPTLSEMLASVITETERDLAGKISDKDRDSLINMMLQSVDNLTHEEKERRSIILNMELDDLDYIKDRQKKWCKHLQLFDTHNPIDRHPRIDSEMVKAYLLEEPNAIKLYDTAKQDYGKQFIAKFLFCTVLQAHSDELEERIKSLSDKFIAKHCNKCSKREI